MGKTSNNTQPDEDKEVEMLLVAEEGKKILEAPVADSMKSSRRPPAGFREGGIWGTNTYTGPQSVTACIGACLLCSFCASIAVCLCARWLFDLAVAGVWRCVAGSYISGLCGWRTPARTFV